MEREALENLIKAWHVLPRGNYSPREIEKWLRENMGPAIIAAKAVLEARAVR